MFYDFTPKPTKKLSKHQRMDSLHIENNVIEYTFTKKRSKTPAEIRCDLLCHNKKFLSPINTLVSVYIDMNTIKNIKFDAQTQTMLIAGKFSVSYRNMHSTSEVIREYDNDTYCISFKYNFNEVDKFIEIVRQYCPNDDMNISVIPLSL